MEEALKDPKWKKAVEEELKALENNNTWIIVDLLKDKKSIDCKWVFTVKYKADGSIERYKARLVTTGFTQSFGVDYHETFAPVAKLNTVRVLLSLAVNENWVLHQLDIKNAFLNESLEEEVYMRIPPGVKSNTGKACRLLKSLYGLKQSPRAWFVRFTKVIIQDGYKQCMEVARSKEEIMINQRKYILNLLSETGMNGCKPTETPMEANLKLRREELRSPAVVSRSSAKEEFRAMALGIYEGIWLQRMLTELGYVPTNGLNFKVTVNGGTVKLNYVSTKNQLADILTKALPRITFDDIISKLGLFNIYSPCITLLCCVDGHIAWFLDDADFDGSLMLASNWGTLDFVMVITCLLFSLF
ncbi:uncharacterized protein LOC120120205 [Hibiscus syriacus]|uniref:uncharacterized protein LOC120120205 n=1 Tax=Hibiscus syriacus TaxID=106335 RepID=UPI00192492A4|nr:uncharacterized protein LOC120120205 [Hibiscus syriacus]